MKLPPYGRQIQTTRNAGQIVRDIRIATGANSWNQARAGQYLLKSGAGYCCLPPGDDPALYDWTICRGVDVTVIDDGTTDPDTLHTLAAVVVAHGAEMAVIVSPGMIPAPIYRSTARATA